MSFEVEEAKARVEYWRVARDKAEDAWLRATYGDIPAWEQERRRRAFEFADKLWSGWEWKLAQARRRANRSHLQLVPRAV